MSTRSTDRPGVTGLEASGAPGAHLPETRQSKNPLETADKLAALAELVAGCSAVSQSDAFALTLIACLRRLLRVDDATVLYYAREELPEVVYRESPEPGQGHTLERFTAGAFLLDPFYSAAQEKHFGLFRLKELAPRRFRDSEYYRNWYRSCGFSDECGYLVDLGSDAFVNIALGRLGESRFSAAEVRTLRSIRPAIDSLCRQHWARDDREGEGLRRHLHSALDNFGSSLLTQRETQVINLILHGHSSRSMAERLGVSMETIKLHRKHAYAKLEVGSQAELFYLFLDSLMSTKNYRGGDTLVTYLQRPAAG